ncbi:hypothetical protein [Spirosoma validum]|uniref:Uncharacterized protein n=1 Tax=Spirosoma validum TaxID=2771355 RepID=A0A927GG44_9BACT|nr:hypothetical protein [Spirosoma validum]MBD2756323.1 hypothetical protein [Spirosoma validum]
MKELIACLLIGLIGLSTGMTAQAATRRPINLRQVSPADTMRYYLDGKRISAQQFQRLDTKLLYKMDVDTKNKIVKAFSRSESSSVEPSDKLEEPSTYTSAR